ncbi:choice-of-anchor H family protein [Thalassotalea sp. Y01]|uniref:choice-of-anchor H family protein n=1 Tax=Thalassotalea sp. Y01 TaxID=2729613 RepID=UPI00145E1A00|nr:choice-of-anchor H family protein [Thalassotalea sp. Y01]NMP17812.1 hypothetical protein [Thalassotalea sp. Y01]
MLFKTPKNLNVTETFFFTLLKLMMLLVAINVLLVVNKAVANETEHTKPAQQHSVSGFANTMNAEVRKTLIKAKKNRQNLPAPLMRQPAALNSDSQSGNLVDSNKVVIRSSQVNHYNSFTIYDAYSELFDDYDYDGYYQSFSVIFDADLTSGPENMAVGVYAVMFIRESNGPWEHYYTTDDFIIIGSDSEDAYEVYTELDEGYYPDYYDILIELYDSEHGYLVASYSSDDSDSLYALPLESYEYDEYDDYHDHHHDHHDDGGSMGIMVLLSLFSLLISRGNNN